MSSCHLTVSTAIALSGLVDTEADCKLKCCTQSCLHVCMQSNALRVVCNLPICCAAMRHVAVHKMLPMCVQEARYRQRYLDGIVNHHHVRNIFVIRAQIVQYVRKYLDDRQFLEVTFLPSASLLSVVRFVTMQLCHAFACLNQGLHVATQSCTHDQPCCML